MKTWFGYYISASKILRLSGLNRALKIIFSKLGNCASIFAIFLIDSKKLHYLIVIS
jgi:hypothetical protein